MPSDREKKSVLFFKMVIENGFWLWEEKCNRAIEEAATCSAIYLLSKIDFVEPRALGNVDRDGIHFTEIRIHGVDLDSYVLFHMARDLYQGSSHIRLSRTYRFKSW